MFRHERKIYVLVTLFTYDLDWGHGDVRLLCMEVSENKNLEPFDEQKSRVIYYVNAVIRIELNSMN